MSRQTTIYTPGQTTTYTQRDYEYIIDDCTPTIIIISDEIQYEKIKNIIPKNILLIKEPEVDAASFLVIRHFEEIMGMIKSSKSKDFAFLMSSIFHLRNLQLAGYFGVKKTKVIACLTLFLRGGGGRILPPLFFYITQKVLV